MQAPGKASMHAATPDLESSELQEQVAALATQTVRSSRKRVVATVAASVLAVSALCAGSFVARSTFAGVAPLHGFASK